MNVGCFDVAECVFHVRLLYEVLLLYEYNFDSKCNTVNESQMLDDVCSTIFMFKRQEIQEQSAFS